MELSPFCRRMLGVALGHYSSCCKGNQHPSFLRPQRQSRWISQEVSTAIIFFLSLVAELGHFFFCQVVNGAARIPRGGVGAGGHDSTPFQKETPRDFSQPCHLISLERIQLLIFYDFSSRAGSITVRGGTGLPQFMQKRNFLLPF